MTRLYVEMHRSTGQGQELAGFLHDRSDRWRAGQSADAELVFFDITIMATDNVIFVPDEACAAWPCVQFGRAHLYALIPSKDLPSGVRTSKGWRL